MEKLIGEYSVVEIPENIRKVYISLGSGIMIKQRCKFLCLEKSNYLRYYNQLPPGNYELIGVSDEITEDQAAGIIESKHSHTKRVYVDYDNEPGRIGYLSAIESFRSLLTNKGLTKRYAILKLKQHGYGK